MTNLKARPIHEIRLGAIRAAVWRTDGETGPRFSVSFSRLYKDDQGQWKDAASFGRNDLPLLVKVADRVHSFLYENPVAPSASEEPNEE